MRLSPIGAHPDCRTGKGQPGPRHPSTRGLGTRGRHGGVGAERQSERDALVDQPVRSGPLAQREILTSSGSAAGRHHVAEHVGRRPIDDIINSSYTPQYNVFDLGFRYTMRVADKPITWRVTANNLTNVHYWSTLGPGSITGQSTGSYLGHLGEPRLLTASMRFNF